MILSAEMLNAKGACREGVKAFGKLFPDGFDLSLWTREVSRILRVASNRILTDGDISPDDKVGLKDLNGNTVGFMELAD